MSLDIPAFDSSALCSQTDPELFFPELGGSNATAKALCRTCPWLDPCRDYALARPELQGIWGATSAEERKRARRGDPDHHAPTPAPCGTPAAAWRHRKHGEPPCRACLDAMVEYDRARRRARKQAS